MKISRARNICNKILRYKVVEGKTYKQTLEIIGVTEKKAMKARGLVKSDKINKCKKKIPPKRMRRFSYTLNSFGMCLDECPYIKDGRKVGSKTCFNCNYNKLTDHSKKLVFCSSAKKTGRG